MSDINPGLTGELEAEVTPKYLASSMGSGGLDILATPYMIALMEGAALQAVQKHLPEGSTTVGTAVDIKHLAPTPQGMKIRGKAILKEIDGRRLEFDVEAFDEKERIGFGTHQRFIVDARKFIEKTNSKKL